MAKKLDWTVEAKELLGKIPFLFRSVARKHIESAARSRGLDEVNVELMNELKKKFMKSQNLTS